MKLSELIELLQKVEKITSGETNVFIRDYEQDRNELFGILPAKDDD
jgi:hypothetical protein